MRRAFMIVLLQLEIEFLLLIFLPNFCETKGKQHVQCRLYIL